MSFSITKLLSRTGQRFNLPHLHGSADAFVLAKTAKELAAKKRLLLILTERAADAQRLLDEMPWFTAGKNDNLRYCLLPDWETLSYDTLSPHQDLISQRLAALYDLQNGRCDVLIVPTITALLRMAPPSFLAKHTFYFKTGETLNEKKFKSQLTLAGYNHVSQVVSPGEYCVRGGLIDLFPMGSPAPYRLDLFGDTIDSIRTFDVDTQRSLESVEEVRLLPGHEFPMDDEACTAFRARWRETIEGDPTRSAIYRDINNGIASAGIEYYLPLFFDETVPLFSYLPEDTHIVLHGDVNQTIGNFRKEVLSRYRFLSADPQQAVLPPEKLFLNEEQFFTHTKTYGVWRMQRNEENLEASELSSRLPELTVNRKSNDPVANLRKFLNETEQRVMICADSPGRREIMQSYFRENDIAFTPCENYAQFISAKDKVMLAIVPLQTGFSLSKELGAVSFITEAELYAGVVRRGARKKKEESTQVESLLRDLSELKIGDPVVHINHGIGRYNGLVTMDLGAGETEFVNIKYARDATLYIPVSQLHVISRYTGLSADDAPLHTLGSGQWERAKQKAAQQVHDTAAELLHLYALRAMRKGHAFPMSQREYEAFADGFGFEETPDQLEAINSVVRDMTSSEPMDRLVCGDVGFGKTEVALRAAFIAVMGGKQVALLAPTTLLAEQHARTFANRFADFPVRIAELSRFKTAKEVSKTIKELTEGSVDIVIGTHKLLSPDVKFQNLGLLIIDEEHRFGVRQKEKLKAVRANVDVLTLTATPIPRTLGMALEGLRSFSIIATAPQKRLSIKTFLRSEDSSIIREACLREIKRGGQVYFLHNDVETIENRRQSLEKLLPEATIAVAHGQMHERELEKVMRDFVAKRYNLLLCTTIIETGIDVPSANTILIHRADKFGLAQLHQLRGRIGRSHHQGYAYMLVNDIQSLTKQARQRLEAILEMDTLGSGFFLAMQDMEIRGIGEILGEEQSGEMHEIGFQLYSDMLKEAVRAMKAGEEPNFDAPVQNTIDINLHTPAILTQDFCPSVNERLSLYKRFAHCENAEAIDNLQEELIDRFGELPEAVQALVETHRLRVAVKNLGLTKIDAHNEAIVLHFTPNPPIDALKIIQMIQSDKNIKLHGQDKLRITADMPDLKTRTARIKQIMKELAQPAIKTPKKKK